MDRAHGSTKLDLLSRVKICAILLGGIQEPSQVMKNMTGVPFCINCCTAAKVGWKTCSIVFASILVQYLVKIDQMKAGGKPIYNFCFATHTIPATSTTFFLYEKCSYKLT